MSNPVILASKLDLSAAADLMTELRAHKGPELVLDMSEVKHLGALCLQVILSAAKTGLSQDRAVAVINTSERVLEQMRVMGMTPEAISRGGV